MNPPKNKYFEKLLLDVKDICEEKELYLDFTGYDDLIEKLKDLKISDPNKAWGIAKECNAWCEYIADIKAIIQDELADIETDKKSIIASVSMKADSNKVANGDRMANADKDVVSIRKKRNKLEALYKMLEDKHQFLIQSHYFTRATCEWSAKCIATGKSK